MKARLPVYAIEHFGEHHEGAVLYANRLNKHVAQHQFTHFPHKHDFYLTALFTAGKGKHEIDFTSYPVKPGTLFILKPGQMHYWWLSPDVDGYVFFHTKEFYEEGFTMERLSNYDFLKPFTNRPYFVPDATTLQQLKSLMQEITAEYEADKPLKQRKIHALINLCYINIARIGHKGKAQQKGSSLYQEKIEQFESLLDKQFKTERSAAYYASKLNVSEKHLNRILKTCLNKTTTQFIAERIVLEAKRMLVQAKYNIEEVGTELGFEDKSYFTRFFRTNSGETPTAFLGRYE